MNEKSKCFNQKICKLTSKKVWLAIKNWFKLTFLWNIFKIELFVIGQPVISYSTYIINKLNLKHLYSIFLLNYLSTRNS